jgi:hypothetical protein
MAVAGALALVALMSALLRTGAMDAGYWIDEAISVGIASRDLADIPGALRQDGSPPLYYLLLHGWMRVAGSEEVATRALSLAFAVLAVPVAWWAGCAVFDRRAGALAAAAAASCPFLTYYAQEARMYSLVAVLSLLASASFALAFLHGRRRHLGLLGLWLVLLLYSHTWGVFLAAGMAAAWLGLWRARRVERRDGVLLGAAVAALYAPWVPSLVFQALHTGAPWAARPSPLWLLGVPGALFGYVAAPFLLAAVITARRGRRDEAVDVARRDPPRNEAVRALAVVAVAAVAAAWLASQFQPAWTPRYLAVLFGPLLLALAATVSRGTRWTAAALAAVAAIWLVTPAPAAKSNVRALAAAVHVRPGDLVVSTQPEQVPVLHRYLPAGAVYVTPLGVVPDPRMVDWRDGLARLRAGRAGRVLGPLLDHVEPGRRILLVMPVRRRSGWEGSWTRVVRVRTREWRAALAADPRVRLIGRAPPSAFPRARSAVRAVVFELRPSPSPPPRRP